MKKIILILVMIIMLMSVVNTEAGSAVNFTAKDIAGNKVNLYGYKDKVVLLDFWATWCGPCRKEIPTLVDIKKTYGDAGFEIVSIALERGNDAGAKKFVKENKMNWVHIINEKTGREIAQKYEIQYIPTMYLIKNGKILATGLRGEALKTKIKELLGK